MLNFRILHGSFGPLLLVLLTVAVENGDLGFLYALLTQLILRVDFESGLISFKGLVVLFEEEVAVTFFRVGLDILGVLVQSLFEAVPGSCEFHEFDEGCALIAVVFGYFGVSSDSLLVLGKGLRVLG